MLSTRQIKTNLKWLWITIADCTFLSKHPN